MEIDSSCYDSSKLVDFPKINTNANSTLKNNSFIYNSDHSNKINANKVSTKESNAKMKSKINKNNSSKEKMKLLISQKIANNKITHMNFNKITSEIINYKNNYITNKDPINQYINYFTPLEKNDYLSSEFLTNNKEFLYDIKKINIKKKKKENEKFLTFKKEKINKYNTVFPGLILIHDKNIVFYIEEKLVS